MYGLVVALFLLGAYGWPWSRATSAAAPALRPAGALRPTGRPAAERGAVRITTRRPRLSLPGPLRPTGRPAAERGQTQAGFFFQAGGSVIAQLLMQVEGSSIADWPTRTTFGASARLARCISRLCHGGSAGTPTELIAESCAKYCGCRVRHLQWPSERPGTWLRRQLLATDLRGFESNDGHCSGSVSRR